MVLSMVGRILFRWWVSVLFVMVDSMVSVWVLIGGVISWKKKLIKGSF